jgi:hypothetical protein
MQPIIDRRADDRQRDALLRIMTGKDTKEAATFFWVYAKMCDTIHDPVFTDITIDLDKDARTARCEAVGAATGRGAPIRNPVTGAEHRVGIHLPHGFEYTLNEVGRGWSQSTGRTAITLQDSYAHWCEIDLNQDGVIRDKAA